MSKRQPFESWGDILRLNTNRITPIIGGMPRGGTTFAYRNLWAVRRNPQPYFLEEYMHFYYEYDYSPVEPKIKINIDRIAQKLQNGITINEGLDPQILVDRYARLIETGHVGKGFMKVFPYHLTSLRNGSEEYYHHILANHWWLMIIRPDWINCMFSNIYSNYFNKFHYYDNQALIRKQFKAPDLTVDNFLKMFKLMYEQQKLQHNRAFVYTDQFTDLKNVLNHHLTGTVTTPRLDPEKPAMFQDIITNYDQVVKYATDYINNEIADYTNGWVTLDSDNELYIDETKR